MAKYALLSGSTVVNIVEWDGNTAKWNPAPLTAVLYNPAVHTITLSPEQANLTTINDYLIQRQARLTAIRTQAQTVVGRTPSAAGTLSSAQLSTAVRQLEVDMKTLASAVDDLAQYDIRLSRRVLDLYDSTD